MRLTEKEQFVVDYLREHRQISNLVPDFHDAFFIRFGGVRSLNSFGVHIVKHTTALLPEMARNDILEKTNRVLAGKVITIYKLKGIQG